MKVLLFLLIIVGAIVVGYLYVMRKKESEGKSAATPSIVPTILSKMMPQSFAESRESVNKLKEVITALKEQVGKIVSKEEEIEAAKTKIKEIIEKVENQMSKMAAEEKLKREVEREVEKFLEKKAGKEATKEGNQG